ncbi:MAG: omptin family outer membrane protease [Deltaproteobacteria bacterium]|nr:omptin family outer membrane protease [Deltaproteobacteria bacterium]
MPVHSPARISVGPGAKRWVKPARNRLFAGLALILVLLGGAAFAETEREKDSFLAGHFSVGAKVRRLLDSYTSYEFGNPFPPYQAPLSRLEFPFDSWWGGVELKAGFPRFSLGLEALRSLSSEADGKMSDSDWDDDEYPDFRSIYSESECHIDPSYMIKIDADLKVSDWLGLPSSLDLRPVIGFRWQHFRLVTHDGVQYTEGDPPTPLPGNGIRFTQTYRQYFIGLKSDLDLTRYIPLHRFTLLVQVDWAYVQGDNEDHHLLRAGERFTFEDTRGQAWHGLLGLKAGVSENLTLGLEFDFLWLSTTGSHRMVNDPFGIDFTFHHGVKVWSRQTSLSLSLQYAF